MCIRAASVGEHLPCRRETTNLADRFAVTVMKGETVVGHIPRKISNICSVFIRKGGSMLCLTTGSEIFFRNPQGLKNPYILVFKGNAKDTAKANKIIEDALNLRKSADLSISDSATGREIDDCV